MRIVSAVLIMLLALGPAQPASAWGFEAHRFVVDRAIALLPPEIRPFFEKYRAAVVEHAIDPDLWRTVEWDAVEGPRHFLDMDHYGPHPFKELPRDYDAAVKKYGADVVKQYGLLPWRTQEMYGRLVEAFALKQTYSRENIKLFSSVVAHYLSDAQVPFHATINHDGQLTNQWGIHARFELELFERYRDKLKLAPKPARTIANVRDFAFDSLTSSSTYVRTILDADRDAAVGREVYDDQYYAMMFAKLQPVLESRLNESITAIASVIATAWEAGGKLPLPADQPRVPQKIRRK
ncbi:MAG TPA: hypothetical protein VH740_24145 [Vicinamibacterales bacterium]|jgi:hypothetical protein